MGYEDDIGKFVSITYKKKDGTVLYAMGKLETIENGLLVIINLSNPNKIKKINPDTEEITILEYSAAPLEVKK